MVQLWTLPSALMLLAPQVQGGAGGFKPIDSLLNSIPLTNNVNHETNATMIPPLQRGPTREKREAERQARSERNRERKRRMREAMKKVKIDPEHVQRVSEKEIEALGEDHPVLRGLGWGSSSSSNTIQYADSGKDWDAWQQAYRMLGGFIDCDHQKDGEGGSQDGGGDDGDQKGCSRWMMWAAYIDPNYQGLGYDEYYGDDATGILDCHNPDTEFVLLGVYRQEFYQFIEQISKHVWAIDEYEYVVALAGLAYMTDDDCFQVGYASDGTTVIYAGVSPLAYGKFQMALYTDSSCLYPNEDLGMTFDDFGLTSDMSLSSQDDGDGGGGDEDSEEWWEASQEYLLTNLNDVYESFKYCTSCIDYPTYQDGYVIGDDGTDDDDLINQCWKFYSHDSFTCEADCIALGHSQGTIVSVDAGGKVYGSILSAYYQDSAARSEAAQMAAAANGTEETAFGRLLANAFVTFSFIVFVATFLAFAVARRSRYRESRNSKTRRLLADDDDGRSRSRKSVRSKSRTRDKGKGEEGDGLFRSSTGRKSRSKSNSGSKSNRRSRSRGQSDADYDPPKSQSRSRSKRSGSKSRRHGEDF